MLVTSGDNLRTVRYFDRDIKVEQARDSELSPFDLCIILAIPYMVGEHEGIQQDIVDSIDLSKGWSGPSVAVTGQSMGLLDRLGPGIHVVEDMDYGDLGVLDGHHRLAKSRAEGLSYVVTQLFPLIHPNIVIGTWLENFEPLDAKEVRRILKTRGEIVPSKATKFQVVDKKGNLQRIMNMQPNVKTNGKTLK